MEVDIVSHGLDCLLDGAGVVENSELVLFISDDLLIGHEVMVYGFGGV